MAEHLAARRLRAFDGHAQDFIADCRARTEGGEEIAWADIDGLWALARGVAVSLQDWRERLARLDLARGPDLETCRAARLIIESLFDEAIAPSALGVFAAALDLALEEP